MFAFLKCSSGLITEQLFCLVSFLWLWTYRNSCLMLSSWPCCWPPAGLCSVTSYQVHISYWLCVWASRYIFITDQRIACYWTVVLFGHLRKSPLGPEKGDCPWPAMQTIFRESFSYVFCQFSPCLADAKGLMGWSDLALLTDGSWFKWPQGLRFLSPLFCAWVRARQAGSVTLLWDLLLLAHLWVLAA